MSTRTTPRGFFAGIAILELGTTMAVRLDNTGKHSTEIWPALPLLREALLEVERSPAFVARVRYHTSPTAYSRHGRVFVTVLDPYRMKVSGGWQLSIRSNPCVERALDLAREPITGSALLTRLHEEFPDSSKGELEAVLEVLRAGCFLLPASPAGLTADASNEECGAVIEESSASGLAVDTFRGAVVGAHALRSTPIGQRWKLFDAEESPCGIVVGPGDVHIDLRFHADAATFSAAVAADVAEAGDILMRLSAERSMNPFLNAYRAEFSARYGGDEVSALELLDIKTGLGPPPSYSCPPGRARSLPARRERRERDAVLAALLDRSDNDYEIELTSSDLEALERSSIGDGSSSYPESLEIRCSIAASSIAAINRGEYRVVMTHDSGFAGAGRSLARFARLLSGHEQAVLRRMVDGEVRNPDEPLVAELVYWPGSEGGTHLFSRPPLLSHEIVVEGNPGVAEANVIALDDIVVGIAGNRFYLRSVTHDRRVLARSTHTANTYLAPNIARFLDEVSDELSLNPFPFDWGSFENQTFLPRVCHGRLVLRPAQWRLQLADVGDSDRTPQIAADFREWRRKWSVPRWVFWSQEHRSSEPDDTVLVDLDDPYCADIVVIEAQRLGRSVDSFVFHEMYPGFDDLWLQGPEGRHLAQFVVPLFQRGSTGSHVENGA
jgi:hypothetical protein